MLPIYAHQIIKCKYVMNGEGVNNSLTNRLNESICCASKDYCMQIRSFHFIATFVKGKILHKTHIRMTLIHKFIHKCIYYAYTHACDTNEKVTFFHEWSLYIKIWVNEE